MRSLRHLVSAFMLLLLAWWLTEAAPVSLHRNERGTDDESKSPPPKRTCIAAQNPGPQRTTDESTESDSEAEANEQPPAGPPQGAECIVNEALRDSSIVFLDPYKHEDHRPSPCPNTEEGRQLISLASVDMQRLSPANDQLGIASNSEALLARSEYDHSFCIHAFFVFSWHV